jgi:hypothetical protein
MLLRLYGAHGIIAPYFPHTQLESIQLHLIAPTYSIPQPVCLRISSLLPNVVYKPTDRALAPFILIAGRTFRRRLLLKVENEVGIEAENKVKIEE